MGETGKKKYCALCPSELTASNRTNEHVIPNSIGGWLKVENFICVACNGRKGNDWDAEISAQFNWIVVMIGIMRDRGEPSKELVKTVSGDSYHILPEGVMVPAKFDFDKKEDGDNVHISFVARSDKEAKTKIKELHKKYPQIDVIEALKQAKTQTTRLEEPLQIARSLGGPRAGRSVVCTALAYAFSIGIDPHACENVQQFLHDPTAPGACYGFFFARELVLNRPGDKTFLCVSLHGSKKNKNLVAYVEYFGIARWLVVLSNEYQGPSFVSTYAVDPTSQESLDLNVDWSISWKMIDRTVNGLGFNSRLYQEAEANSLWMLRFLTARRTLGRKIPQITEQIREKFGYGPDDVFSREAATNFIDAVLNEIDYSLLMNLNAKLSES